MPNDPPPPPPPHDQQPPMPPTGWQRRAVYDRAAGTVTFIETRPPPADIPFTQINDVLAWVRGKEDAHAAAGTDPVAGALSSFHLDKAVQEETLRNVGNLSDADAIALLQQLIQQMQPPGDQ